MINYDLAIKRANEIFKKHNNMLIGEELLNTLFNTQMSIIKCEMMRYSSDVSLETVTEEILQQKKCNRTHNKFVDETNYAISYACRYAVAEQLLGV